MLANSGPKGSVTDYRRAAANYGQCGERTTSNYCEHCHTVWEKEVPCDLRICDKCAGDRTRRVVSKYKSSVLDAMNHRSIKFMTLTKKNVDDLEKSDAISKLRDDFKKLKRRQYEPEGSSSHTFGHRMFGGIYAIEVNHGSNGWNIHMHVLYEGLYIDFETLQDTWKDITGGSFMVNIKRARDGEENVTELCKYVAKPPHVSKENEDLRPETEAERLFEYFKATYRVPMVQVFGKFHAADDKHDTIKVHIPAAVCPSCGSGDIVNKFQDPVMFAAIAPDKAPDPGPGKLYSYGVSA